MIEFRFSTPTIQHPDPVGGAGTVNEVHEEFTGVIQIMCTHRLKCCGVMNKVALFPGS